LNRGEQRWFNYHHHNHRSSTTIHTNRSGKVFEDITEIRTIADFYAEIEICSVLVNQLQSINSCFSLPRCNTSSLTQRIGRLTLWQSGIAEFLDGAWMFLYIPSRQDDEIWKTPCSQIREINRFALELQPVLLDAYHSFRLSMRLMARIQR
jgi:hypothetical protein